MLRASLACTPIALLLLLASCAERSSPQTAYVPPPLPKQPPAPWCARPAEIGAFNIAALKTNLMVVALKCNDVSRYNDFVGRYRQTLVRNEAAADGYFSRNNKRRWQESRDNYITNLANAQSQRATVLGDQFCPLTQGAMDEVLALAGSVDLPGYADSKTQSIPQAMQFSECLPESPKPAPAPRRTKRHPIHVSHSGEGVVRRY
jgi:hypothetical protein